MENENKNDRSQQTSSAGNQFETRFHRLKIAAGAKSDTELGKSLGLTQQSIGAARKKKQIPPVWITRICEKHRISADWLLFGEGAMKREGRSIQIAESPAPYGPTTLNESLLQAVIKEVEEIIVAHPAALALKPGKKAQLIATLYELFAEKPGRKVDRSTVMKLVKLAL